MAVNKYKRWQWWVCVITLSPIIVISFLLSFIGGVLEFVGERLDSINYMSTPRFIVRFVKWGGGQ